LTRTDRILAAIDIALPIASEVARAPLARQVIKGINHGMNIYAAYESASDYQKAKELDPEIFARYSAKTGIKEERLGIVSGKQMIKLGKGAEAIRNKKLLEEISEEVAREKTKPQLKIAASDYYNYEAW